LAYVKLSVGIPEAAEELKNLKFIFLKNPDFQEFLNNLGFIYSEKCRVIDAVLKDFSEETRIFIKLLLEKGRIANIMAICDYVRVNYSPGERVSALLKTSYSLDLDLIREIKEKLENKFNKRFKLHLELDAALLGGIQVTIGNTVIDGSVRRRLDELKEKLMTARVN